MENKKNDLVHEFAEPLRYRDGHGVGVVYGAAGDVGFQWRDYLAQNVTVQIHKVVQNKLATGYSIRKAYAERRVEIHVHVSCRIGGVGCVPEHYCALFQYAFVGPDAALDPLHINVVGGFDPKVKSGPGTHYEVDVPVLVGIAQRMDLPEGVVPVSIPSVVRLQTLDDCLRRLTNPTGFRVERAVVDNRSIDRFSLPVLIPEDGELRFIRDILADSASGQGVCQAVERGPQVVERIADQERKRRGGETLMEDDPYAHLIRSIGIGLADDGVAFWCEPPPELDCQVLQVMNRPLQFEHVAVGGGHDPS
jgi:hypothetical protein